MPTRDEDATSRKLTVREPAEGASAGCSSCWPEGKGASLMGEKGKRLLAAESGSSCSSPSRAGDAESMLTSSAHA
eukprot:6174999-Pleurochrysis_carterae.AAC.1